MTEIYRRREWRPGSASRKVRRSEGQATSNRFPRLRFCCCSAGGVLLQVAGSLCQTVGNNHAGISRKMKVVSPTFAVNVVIPRVCFQPTKLGRCSLDEYI